MGLQQVAYRQSLLPVLAMLACAACEETIYPDLSPADPVLVVDAWINNKPEEQVIRLSWSQPYLEHELPPPVLGATVFVRYDTAEITFAESDSVAGQYVWSPAPADTTLFNVPGRDYHLTVSLPSGNSYQAMSMLRRTVPIDSITYELQENRPFFPDNSYTAEFWAQDAPGKGDTYWIKAYKNGILLNRPSEIKLAYDAGFTAGGNFDGVTFIPPLRNVSPFEQGEDDRLLPPYEKGDSVYVEIHSITLEAFNFLNEVIIQTDRPGSIGELFATPLANVSTNIRNVDPAAPPAVGFFCVSAVSGLGRRNQ